MIAETIAGMKRTMYGHHELPDSENTAPTATNRGLKLKRKAQSVQEGQLSGNKVYKRKVEHAGYQRYILHQNPKRYDHDGDELEDDEVDERADVEAVEHNPYGQVKLEEILMPLTAAAELPIHPALSIPYKSTMLSDMVQQSSEMLHKERRTLWIVKRLLTTFRGDCGWNPGEHLVSVGDATLFGPGILQKKCVGLLTPWELNRHKATAAMVAPCETRKPLQGKLSVDTMAEVSPRGPANALLLKALEQEEVATRNINHVREPQIDINIEGSINQVHTALGTPPVGEDVKLEAVAYPSDIPSHGHEDYAIIEALKGAQTSFAPDKGLGNVPEHNAHAINAATGLPGNGAISVVEPPTEDLQPREEVHRTDSVNPTEYIQAPSHRMTTRAQAQAVSDKTLSSHTRSPSPNAAGSPYIHPLYFIPQSALPDRDFGLPSLEAEETRRMLIMWVQKQEEVVRGVERLYAGLLKADQMRKTLFKWCQSEGHVGEMSDGEDWYDKEEWGLDEDLKKGQLEDEDDTLNQGKKTRARRSAQ
ncbi:hypothetical protein MMC13_004262 [Lambiella insularis]|nr:hypothetical protein [Lambiella insularis]